jgi:flagellar motor protein MotB
MGHQKVKGMVSMNDPRVCLIGHPAPAWMVNYADLMTELVCFFIVLYALSASLNKDVQKAKKDVEEAMKKDQVAAEVKIDKDGMKITIEEKGENVFFESGSAELSPKMDEILGKLAPSLMMLAKDGHDIIVEGHTDNVPIRNRFASNWELSTARATNVVQHMIKSQRFPPEHLGAIGYGEYHPIVPNDSEEHRSTNRRVVFFVKNTPDKFQPTKGTKPEKTEGTEAPADTAVTGEATATDAPASEAPAASTEPTTDNALPLPQEAPAESTTNN